MARWKTIVNMIARALESNICALKMQYETNCIEKII